MAKQMMLTGNYAAAYGVKLADVDVVPIYPITPQTSIIEKIVELIDKKEIDAEFIPAESEHSVMAMAVSAQATGARCFTASSAQGLVYMHENLFVASGCRLPVVMCMVCRALGTPQGLGYDFGDALDQRDTSWIQIYLEDAQEILDMVIQAYKIAEDKKVLLPVAIAYEGFAISHYLEPVTIPDREMVKTFLPAYTPHVALSDVENPVQMGYCDMNGSLMTEIRYQQHEAMENAKSVIEKVDLEYGKIFGRSYGGHIEKIMMEDAQIAILAMGSIVSTSRIAVTTLREKGLKIGLLKLRVFRPFPWEKIIDITKNLKMLIVLDRDVSIGSTGIVYSEVAGALYNLEKRPLLLNYILGLGGRDITVEMIVDIVSKSINDTKNGKVQSHVNWYGVRGL